MRPPWPPAVNRGSTHAPRRKLPVASENEASECSDCASVVTRKRPSSSRALDSLEPLLRVYEGCARAYLGEVEGANLIKLHRHSGKVSYLVYPDFETDPHPALLRSIKLSLRTRELDCFDYAKSTNPPILHRKEAFLPPGHPLVARFARLTRQEESTGCSTRRRRSAPARAGNGGWRSGDSGSRASAGAAEGRKGRRDGTTKLTRIEN